MSNVLNFNVVKNTLELVDGAAPVSSELNYSELVCHFKEDDDWADISILTAGFFVYEDEVYQKVGNIIETTVEEITEITAAFSIPSQLCGNQSPIYFGLCGSILDNGEVVKTISTNAVAIDIRRGVLITSLSENAAEEASICEQLLAALNAGLATKANSSDVYTKTATDELLATKANSSDVTTALESKANSSDVTAALATKANAADVYSKTEADTLLATKANSSDVTDALAAKANSSDVYTKTATDELLAAKADSNHTHSQYLTAHQDISGKEDKSNKVTSMSGSSTDTQYPSAKAVYDAVSAKVNSSDVTKTSDIGNGSNDELIKSNSAGVLSRSGYSVDGNSAHIVNSSSANSKVPTAKAVAEKLAEKADSNHTHSQYLTSHQDISGKEDKTNKVTSMSSDSTDTQYPSAKAVFDALAGKYKYVNAGEAIDDCTENDTIYRVKVVSGIVPNANKAIVFCARGVNEWTQYAFTPSGYIIFRKGTVSNNQVASDAWSEWDYVPSYSKTAELISKAIKQAVGVEAITPDDTYNLYDGTNKSELYDYMSAADYTDYTYDDSGEPIDFSNYLSVSHIDTTVTVSSIEDNSDKSQPAPVTIPTGAAKVILFDTVTKKTWVEDVYNGYSICNLIPNHTHFYAIYNSSNILLKAGSCKAVGQVRWIDARAGASSAHPYNVRDIGGWTCDGGHIKYGVIFRGSELNNNVTLTDAQKKLFVNVLGVCDEIDLREDNANNGSDTSLNIGEVGYEHIELKYYQSSLTSESRIGQYVKAVKRIAKNISQGVTTYLHCSAGSDRTGQLCLVLEAICGVGRSDLDRDFELSTFSKKTYGTNERNTRKRNSSHDSGIGHIYSAAIWCNFIYVIDGMTDAFEETDPDAAFSRKIITMLLQNGVTIDEINAIRSGLIEGNPQKLTSPYGDAAITKTLTNVGVDNSATSVSLYQPFEAALTVKSGYKAQSVTLTMGGTDVTSSYYSNGRISIPIVTGDIVITASAAALKTSDLINDSGFLTSHQDISGKADSSNVYTKTQTENKVYEIVDDTLSENSSDTYPRLTVALNDGAYYLTYIDSEDTPHYLFNVSSIIPTNISDLTNDSGYMPVVDVESISDCTANNVLYRLFDNNNCQYIFNVIVPESKWYQYKITSSGIISARSKTYSHGAWGSFGDFINYEDTYYKASGIDNSNKTSTEKYPSVKAVVDYIAAQGFLTSHQDISGKYDKPSGGIPKTDLASAVQTSLGKADSSVQPADVYLKSALTTKTLSVTDGSTTTNYSVLVVNN